MLESRIDELGVLWLAGDLDLSSASSFAEVAQRALDGRDELVIDLSEAGFIDSRGLREIVVLAVRAGELKIVLRHPSASVTALLDLSGIEGRLGIRVER
jgi:anti-anti-sigma factor